MFENLRSPNAKWYSRRNSVEFSVAPNMRILVRDIDAVSPWYVEKLGLLKSVRTQPEDASSATFRFKADGRPVVLTTRSGIETTRHPTLFTKKIRRIRDVMSARGIDVGAIEQDRQGFDVFQIHDPEGNAIEVAEER
ncbi:MAG: VOC family protein [Terriglobales bacterium]